MNAARLIVGDVIAELERLPTASAHVCVTSPPFWCLRDYDLPPSDWPEVTFVPMAALPAITVPAQSIQLGMEHDPWAFVAHIVHVFRALRRVLRPDGTLWLNMGDSYASGGRGGGGSYMEERGDASWKGASSLNGWRKAPRGLRRKDLLGMPWRVAFALQADGWILRSDIVWEKPNCMPESAEDRPTKCHEYLFCFSASDLYYYDADAIRESVTGGSHTRGGGVGGKTVPPGHDRQGRIRQNERFGRAVRELVTSRNKRTVWSIPTEPYKGKHYATFPRALARPCILAGTSQAGCCAACGAPFARDLVIEGPSFNQITMGRPPSSYANAWKGNPHSFAVRGSHGHISRVRRTRGWLPSCKCGAEPKPCVVIDPFSGTATAGEVAVMLGRDFIGIDLSTEYSEQARYRLARAHERLGLAVAQSPATAPAESAQPLQLGLLGEASR
jgi:DNA modification methylase